eukprot:Gb_04330 [translate_table: standard]
MANKFLFIVRMREAHFIELPRLRCLDLENIYMITDAWASYLIPGMRNLQALNMNGTSISDGFLEALTYGCRLQSWVAEQDLATVSVLHLPLTFASGSKEIRLHISTIIDLLIILLYSLLTFG